MSEVAAEVMNGAVDNAFSGVEDAAAQSPEKTEDFSEVYNLYLAHADVIAPCHWAGGAIMKLRDAMPSHQGPWTSENAPAIMGDIWLFKSNEINPGELETESNNPLDSLTSEIDTQPEDGDQKKEALAGKSEAPPEQKKELAVDRGQADLKPGTPSQPESLTSLPESVSEPAPAVEVEVAVGQFTENTKNSAEPAAKNEPGPRPETIAIKKVGGMKSDIKAKAEHPVKEAQPATSGINSASRKVKPQVTKKTNELKPEIKPASEAAPNALKATKVKIKTEETGPDIADSGRDVAEQVNQPQLAVIEGSAKIETPHFQAPAENLIVPDIGRLVDEKTVAAGEPELDSTELPSDEAATFSSFEDLDLPWFTDESYLADQEYASSSFKQVEAVELDLIAGGEVLIFERDGEDLGEGKVPLPDRPTELFLQSEKIEDKLYELVELIINAEPETAELVDIAIVKIIEAPTKLGVSEFKQPEAELKLETELEKLFVNLFETVRFEYPQSLVEELARLTIRLHKAGQLPRLKSQATKIEAPQGVGTHEIINQLVIGFSDIQQAAARADELGHAAGRLTLKLAA